MFTGIIKDQGKVISQKKGRLIITSKSLSLKIKPGDSLAVSGVCLTVVEVSPPRLIMDVLEETIKRSNLGQLKPGDTMNLEPALKWGEEVGGHLVTGHVDGRGKLISRSPSGRDWIFKIALPFELLANVVIKGPLAVEGVSLTVADVSRDTVSIHIIPYTFDHTNLGLKTPGSWLNIESDLLGKYVAKYLAEKNSSSHPLDWKFLKETGFI